MRKYLNKILRKYNYELIVRSHFIAALNKHYRKTKTLTFVQIGANDGVRFDDLYDFVTHRNSQGLVVEPIKFYFEKLKQNYAAYPSITPVNMAIHSQDKTATIHYVDPSKSSELPEWTEGMGSLNPDHHKKGQIDSAHMISEQVACCSLMELFDTYHINNLDLLQIDVEGYDAEIIKLIDFSVIKPYFIKYESCNLSSSDRMEAEDILRKAGYRLFEEHGDTIAICSTN